MNTAVKAIIIFLLWAAWLSVTIACIKLLFFSAYASNAPMFTTILVATFPISLLLLFIFFSKKILSR